MAARKHWIRLARSFSWALGLLVPGIFFALAWVFFTTSGTQIVVRMGVRLIPELRIEAVEGSLWQGMRLKGVAYDDDAGLRVTAQEIVLAVDWPALRAPLARLRTLALTGVRVDLPQGEAQTNEDEPFVLPVFTLPAPPLPVSLPAIDVASLLVRLPSGETLEFASIGARLRWEADGAIFYHARLDGLAGEVSGVHFAELGATVSGDGQRFRMDDLAGTILGARISARLDAEPRDEGIAWDAAMELSAVDLAALRPWLASPLNGSIGAKLTTRGYWGTAPLAVQLSVSELNGAIEGRPLAGRMELDLEGDRLRLRPAELTLGENSVWLEGTASPPFDLAYRLRLPQLAALPLPGGLIPPIQGSLAGEGRIAGTLDRPEVKGQLEGRALSLAEWTLAAFSLRAEVRQDRLELATTLRDLKGAGRHVRSASLSARGRMAGHALTLTLDSDVGRVALGLQGALQENRWNGTLERLILNGTPGGDWHLKAPASLRMHALRVSLRPACFAPTNLPFAASAETLRKSELCLMAETKADGQQRALLEATLPLALLDALLPPTLSLPSSSASLRAEAELGPTPELNVQVHVPDDEVHLHAPASQPLALPYRDVAAHLTVRDKRLKLEFTGTLTQRLFLEGNIQAQLEGRRSLEGLLSVRAPQLSWLGEFAPEQIALDGSLDGSVRMSGTVDTPLPQAEFVLDLSRLELPPTGVRYVDGRLHLRVDPSRRVALEGSLAGASGGSLHLNGVALLADLPQWQARLDLQGEALPVLRTPELTVDASPNLRLTADERMALLRGHLLLPRAEAKIRTLPEGAVKESADLRVVGQSPPPAPYPLGVDVDVVLGERVSLEGFGFSTKLSGNLRLRGDGHLPLAAFGEVSLREGRYEAYGQALQIARGRLLFTGALDNPILEVRAERTVGAYLAGLELLGSLQQPRSRVYAQPALPEAEALSLLLTGHRLSQVRGGEAQLLLGALSSLGVNRGEQIAREIGLALGLDEVGLSNGSGNGSSQLTLGKRLGPDLLVRYAIGVTDGVGKVITEYRLSRHLRIELFSSPTSQGGDLIYRIER
ncbi:translocation/assembly module TamB domain-containing protein [Tepidiphilus sp. J10]|uniref:translocation/assembly module TamB domain-containing protein n=1 Tax=Tepidiphilus sp. J10 TaxID=2502185 RepID=UPI00115CE204|nr:translocation/assembly module TamB domain-containing protein [Tepidiphilus sp. J10]